jgi:hypothetical protein
MLSRSSSAVQNRKYSGLLTVPTSAPVAVIQVSTRLGMIRSRTYSVGIDVRALLGQVRNGLRAVQNDKICRK